MIVKQFPTFVNSAGKLTEDFGLEIMKGGFAPLLKTGRKVPCEATFTFSTFADNQDQIILKLYHGTGKVVIGNRFIGSYQIVSIPPAPTRVPIIAVTFHISAEAITLTAVDQASKTPMDIKRLD